MPPKALVPATGPVPGAIPQKRTAAGGAIIDALRGDDQPLYDRRLLTANPAPANPILEFRLFNEDQGGARGFPSTNVPEGNTVPGELTFSVRGFGLRITPTYENADTPILRRDMVLLLASLFVFYKNNNRRYQIRLASLGSGGGLWGVGQGAADPPDYQNGIPSVNDRMHLKSAIPLQAQDNFHCALEWDGAGANVEGVNINTNVLIEVTLYGIKAGMIDRTG